MKKNYHIWLLRIYSLIILVVLLGKFLEGVAFNLVIVLAAIAIIIQSFLIEKK